MAAQPRPSPSSNSSRPVLTSLPSQRTRRRPRPLLIAALAARYRGRLSEKALETDLDPCLPWSSWALLSSAQAINGRPCIRIPPVQVQLCSTIPRVQVSAAPGPHLLASPNRDQGRLGCDGVASPDSSWLRRFRLMSGWAGEGRDLVAPAVPCWCHVLWLADTRKVL